MNYIKRMLLLFILVGLFSSACSSHKNNETNPFGTSGSLDSTGTIGDVITDGSLGGGSIPGLGGNSTDDFSSPGLGPDSEDGLNFPDDLSGVDFDELASLWGDALKTVNPSDPGQFPQALQSMYQQLNCSLRRNGAPFGLLYQSPYVNAYHVLAGMYLDLLGRLPSDPISNWREVLQTSGPAELAHEILISETSNKQAVRGLYRSLLRQDAPEARQTAWHNWLKNHRRVDNNAYTYERLISIFAQYENSNRYWVMSPVSQNDYNFVRQLFRDVLKREGQSSEITAKANARRHASSSSRFYTAWEIVRSDENRTQFIVTTYRKFLGRSPLGGELSSGLSSLRAGKDFITFITDVMGSPEYVQRQGRRFSPILNNGLCQ